MYYTNDDSTAADLGPRFRLENGMEILECWSFGASQAMRNAVYRVLFSVLDGSVFRRYQIVDNYAKPQDFCVYLHDELVIKFRLGDDVFTIDYIGPACDVPVAG